MVDIKSRPAKLTGLVVDAATRRPVPSAKVSINRAGYSENSDRNGTFLFDKLKKGTIIIITCTKRGYKQAQVTYKANMDQEQTLSIKLGPIGGFGKSG